MIIEVANWVLQYFLLTLVKFLFLLEVQVWELLNNQ